VLDVPLSIPLATNVREFLLHIFAVELCYAERLKGLPITAYETLPTGTEEGLFGIGEQARAIYREYLGNVTDEDLAIIIKYPHPHRRDDPRQYAQDRASCHDARSPSIGRS
jgi:uncharacterized damage-inducible protein DinB